MSRPSLPIAPAARPASARLRAPTDAGGSPIAIGALLIAAALLRIGAAGSGAAVQLDLTDLGHGHPSGSTVGLVGAAQALAEMFFALFLARFADRFGRRRFLIGGPLLGVLGTCLVAGAVHPFDIAWARVLEGVGAAAFVPTALGTIAAATTADSDVRASASGAFEGATLIGYAGGFIIGPFVYHSIQRGAFLVLGVLYLSAAVVCWRLVPRVPPLPVSPVRTVVRAITGPGPIRSFIPAWLAVNGLVGAWLYNVVSVLRRSRDPNQTLVHHFDERLIGVFLLMWVVLLLAGIVLWTPVLRRLGGPLTMRRATPGAYLVCAGLLAMNHLSLHYGPVFLPVVIAGILIQAGFGPAAVAYLADCSEELAADRSALMAFYTVTLAGGGAAGALIGGALTRWLLFDGLVLLGFVLTTLALVALGKVIRFEQSRGSLRPVSRTHFSPGST